MDGRTDRRTDRQTNRQTDRRGEGLVWLIGAMVCLLSYTVGPIVH